MKFCFATFCFGERYYEQVNRFIDDISKSDFHPSLIVMTDNPEMIKNECFVTAFNIKDFNPEYSNYANNYYDFDFSVKRYSVLAAFKLGFTNVILIDADMRVNYGLFNEENIINSFKPNSIMGPVTYSFSEQINTNSELGNRLLEYERHFNISVDKETLNFMPEDCIQYISIDEDKFSYFLSSWDRCISYKQTKPLRNIPAGNIDEMCFSALINGIKVGNNSDKSLNIIYAQHDKWY
jgi:hypothetical protein